MASITPSVAPGVYPEAQPLTFTFSDDIVSVAMTKNAAPPSITKYIAYDTLTPPNPFLAVTDGSGGRVTYDGGFPKYYNGANPTNPATFADLSSAGKYLFNSLKWVANPVKVASGNTQVLVIGDKTVAEGSYAVKSTTTDGFFDSITAICTVAGFVPTFKDTGDYANGIIEPTPAELDQYACVVFISSMWTDIPRITPLGVGNLDAFRQNGNGLVLITDHGYDLASIEDVHLGATYGAFFKTVNMLAYQFGSYFTGNYDRTPVNVGFIRQNYGDHPLYAGLADTDDMPAGPSESKVVTTAPVPIPVGDVSPTTADQDGVNTFNFLVSLTDGSTMTSKFTYGIQLGEFLFVKTKDPSTGNDVTNSTVWASPVGQLDLRPSITGLAFGNAWGELLIKGKRVGEVSCVNNVTHVYWYAGAGKTPVHDQDDVAVIIHSPFEHQVALKAQRKQIDTSAPHVALAQNVTNLRPLLNFNGVGGVLQQIKGIVDSYLPADAKSNPVSPSAMVAYWQKFLQGNAQLGALSAPIYATTASAQAAVAAAVPAPGMFFIDAQANQVYGYTDGTIQLVPALTAQDIFGSPRVITSTGDAGQFQLEDNGTITAL